MKKKNIILVLATVALVSIVTGCGKSAKVNEVNAVTLKGIKITANSYYDSIKTKEISGLIDTIDHKLFDNKYKTDSTETKAIDEQITKMKANYTNNESGFLTAIKQYFGVNSEAELRQMLSLEYKRNEAVKDYIGDTLTDAEINSYYQSNISGDIDAKHILIKSTAKDNATDAEKSKAEAKAKATATDIIKQLNSGADFAKLAKKYSADTASASNGGNLGYISSSNTDSDFWSALSNLKDGTYTKEPVKTQYGYHIIYRIKSKAKPKLSKVKASIKETLANDKLTNDATLHYKTLVKIREKNNITWNDATLKKAYDKLMEQLIENASSSSTTN